MTAAEYEMVPSSSRRSKKDSKKKKTRRIPASQHGPIVFPMFKCWAFLLVIFGIVAGLLVYQRNAYHAGVLAGKAHSHVESSPTNNDEEATIDDGLLKNVENKNDGTFNLEKDIDVPEQQQHQDETVVCVGDRLSHEIPLKAGEYICSKHDQNYILGMNSHGDFLWKDRAANETKVYYKASEDANADHEGYYFMLKVDGRFIVYDEGGGIQWERACTERIYFTEKCLEKYDCPYLHLHGGGTCVLNWIDDTDDIWYSRNIKKIYNLGKLNLEKDIQVPEQQHQDEAVVCVGDRLSHEIPLKAGEYICSKHDQNYILGMNSDGDFLWKDRAANETKLYYKASEDANAVHEGYYFMLKVDGRFVVYDEGGGIQWQRATSELIYFTEKCLEKYDCPYLHLHGSGTCVLNWIDGTDDIWYSRNIKKIYNWGYNTL